ncbi:hypothetical protein [Terrabacter carboxydivorans]|uniref:Uncharacterized protein n=1 Tax=Terrabacter carboxydivorans TaxID=619730 RepID=A0ABN3LYG3_9MICO
MPYGTARYLISEQYAPEYVAAKGQRYSHVGWLYKLLHLCPRRDLIAALTLAARVASDPAERDEWTAYVLANVDPTLAAAMRSALAPTDRGPHFVFLARQPVLLALRAALTEPVVRGPGDDDPRIAATLLSHHVAHGDMVSRYLRGPEPVMGGRPESDTMHLVVHALFNLPLDYGALIARTEFLWTHYESQLTRYPPRAPLRDMVREATGLDLEDILALAFALFAHVSSLGVHSTSVALDMSQLGLPADVVSRFLTLFSDSRAGFARALKGGPVGAGEWFFLPFENRPLLRLSKTDVLVIDMVLLQRRFTSALYWLVHDHERDTHGNTARIQWTQTYSELVEMHAEHLLKDAAPPMLDGTSSFFTEETVRLLGGSAADCGIDFGDFVLVADIVQHNVKVPARAFADASAFRDDVKKSVLGKARQLDDTIEQLLTKVAHRAHPLGRRPRRVVPMVVEGAEFPVIAETTAYINDELESAGLLRQPECTRLLVVTLAELEMLASLIHAGIVASARAAIHGYAIDRGGDSFTNHLHRNYAIGGPMLRASFMAQQQSLALAEVLKRLQVQPEDDRA